jgi:hypothetical protein
MRLPSLILTIVAVAPTSATAQHTGSIISKQPPNVFQQNQADTHWAIYTAARCATRRAPESARAILSETKANPVPKHWSRFVQYYSECMERASRIQMRVDVVRGAVAESFFRTEYLERPAPFDLALTTSFRPAGYGKTGEEMMVAIADCVVRRDWAGSTALLKTDVASKEHDRAVAALVPTLGQCFPAGRQIKFDKLDVRGAIAEAIYRSFEPGSPSRGAE